MDFTPASLDIQSSPHHDVHVRTTLEVQDDIYQIARELARDRLESIGKVLSDLARRGLSVGVGAALDGTNPIATRNGVPLLPKRPGERRPVTNDIVQNLLNAE